MTHFLEIPIEISSKRSQELKLALYGEFQIEIPPSEPPKPEADLKLALYGDFENGKILFGIPHSGIRAGIASWQHGVRSGSCQ